MSKDELKEAAEKAAKEFADRYLFNPTKEDIVMFQNIWMAGLIYGFDKAKVIIKEK